MSWNTAIRWEAFYQASGPTKTSSASTELKFIHHNYHNNNNFHGASAYFRGMATPITEPNSKTFKIYAKVNVQAA
jgi:hypothetical protein